MTPYILAIMSCWEIAKELERSDVLWDDVVAAAHDVFNWLATPLEHRSIAHDNADPPDVPYFWNGTEYVQMGRAYMGAIA